MDKKLIGKKIKKYRKRKNLTQEALGEKAGLHYTYIGQVERGEKDPSFKFLRGIAAALEISVDRLLINYQLDSEAKEIISDITQLLLTRDEEELKMIYDFLEDLTDLLEHSKAGLKIDKDD